MSTYWDQFDQNIQSVMVLSNRHLLLVSVRPMPEVGQVTRGGSVVGDVCDVVGAGVVGESGEITVTL